MIMSTESVASPQDEEVLRTVREMIFRPVKSFKVTGSFQENDSSEAVIVFEEAIVDNPASSSPSFLYGKLTTRLSFMSMLHSVFENRMGI
jgi:hypothetical protein